ncbi:unnamed protein product [Durusdinium trenchii]|uniref:Ion transport domain-containing protein n=1 Tax=Durusdinium trenchii TaxID=1381693 RepID=A0ABP0HCN5_9DINO
MFCCRLMNYVGSLGPLTILEIRQLVADVRAGSFKSLGCLMVPTYLLNFHECLRFVLMWLLIIMFSQEPFLHCLSAMDCPQGRQHQDVYSGCAFLAMIIFWTQLLDLAIFSEKIMACVLVCSCLVADMALFLLALLTILLAFTVAIGTLHYHVSEHGGAGAWLRELTLMALRMYAQEHYLELKGIARLKRANITCTTLKDIPQHRRMAFLDSLGLEVLEPAIERVVTEDTIKRFGGPSAPTVPWPKEEADKLAALENKLMKVVKSGKAHRNSRTCHGGSGGEGSGPRPLARPLWVSACVRRSEGATPQVVGQPNMPSRPSGCRNSLHCTLHVPEQGRVLA